MIFIQQLETNPYFNVAAEEFLLKHKEEDVVLLWQSEPSVVIGKHQNAISEINLDWIRKKNIPVVRRISGGGTVYHDAGNINYSVIKTESRKDRLIDFQKFTNPIIEFLAGFGIEAKFNGKNNLFIGDKKISGNAAHVHKNRVMHHGTILFNSKLDDLENSIKPIPGKTITDKAVQSVRSTVTNILDHLPVKMVLADFKSEFEKFMINYHNINKLEVLSKDNITAISKLVDEKYKTWDWTFGYSPNYQVQSTLNVIGGQTKLLITVEKGLLKSFSFDNTTKETNAISLLLQKLVGLPHHPDALDPYIRKITTQNSDLKYINKLLF